MNFQSFEEALKICLAAEDGSPEQDEALVYCMEHAPDDLKEMLRKRFMEFHTGRHDHDGGCSGSDHPKKTTLSDFIK